MATDFRPQWDIIVNAVEDSKKRGIATSSLDEVQPAVTAIMNALADKTYTPSPYDLSRCADLPDRVHVQKLDPHYHETDFHCTVLLIELKRAMEKLMSKRERTRKNLQHLSAAYTELADAIRRHQRFLKIHPNPVGYVQQCADWFGLSVPVDDAKEALIRALRDSANTPISQDQLKRYSEFPDAIRVLCRDKIVREVSLAEIKTVARERLQNRQFVNPGCGTAIFAIVSTVAVLVIYAVL